MSSYQYKIINISRNIVSVPTIKAELKDIRCCDGDAVTLECKVYAPSEPPNIRWEKSGKVCVERLDYSADIVIVFLQSAIIAALK